jgi:hypothetical protein
MKGLRARLTELRSLLQDRRRSQRGSVLSAVLILVAFLAIISGAITTELSTSFLLSRALFDRVNTEATVNSAAELGINQLQGRQLNKVCPGPVTTPTLNNLTATATYASCEAVIHRGESTAFTSIASSNPFNIDGTYAQGLNEYVVGDAGGNVFDYPFGSSASRWKIGLGGSVTAPPAVIPDPNDQGEYLDLIPLSGSPCAPASFCVAVLSDGGSPNKPQLRCTMASAASIDSQPGTNSDFAYAGDSAGNLYAMDLTSSEPCDVNNPISAGDPIVAGPVAFACQPSCGGNNKDEVLVVTSNSTSSHVLTYSYSSKGFKTVGSGLSLPWPAASGIALDSSALPANVAITFSGGRVALVHVDTSANPTLTTSVGLPTGIAGAPFWCLCPGSPVSLNLIGVGGGNGALYVLDARNIAGPPYGTYLSGSGIRTAPAADAMGDWYFGADDGQLYEVVKQGTSMVPVASYGPASGPIGSSPVVGTCPAGICAYLGSSTSNLYELSLDARSAVITACISSAPQTCSGANPRLWTSVEVGVSGSPRTVHVQGWSYYSP